MSELHREADAWFVGHGLPWFVPGRREAARRALHRRSTYVGLGVVALVGLALGTLLARLSGDIALAPATLVNLTALAMLVYAARALGGWPILRWAGHRALGSLRMLLPLVTRALPLLLLFVTFLFINAEVWELSAHLDGGVLWVTVLLFAGFAVTFLVVRIPEEMDQFDQRVDARTLVEACRRTPLEAHADELVRRHDVGGGPRQESVDTGIHGYERANLVLVLVIAQAVQVLLLAFSVFVFFMVFGGIVMNQEVQASWIGDAAQVHGLPFASNLSVELLQVSVFLAAFSGLYFTVYAVTDETYRDQFFTEVKQELERAIGVRAVYVTLPG